MKTASCVSQCQNLTNVANCVVQCDFVGSWRNIKMLRHFAKVSERSHWINLLTSSSTYFITSAFFKECSYCQWKLAPRIWKHEDLAREPKSQNYGFCVKHSVKKTDFWKAVSSALQTQAFTTPTRPEQIIFTGRFLIVLSQRNVITSICFAMYYIHRNFSGKEKTKQLPISGTRFGTLTPRLDSLHALQQ